MATINGNGIVSNIIDNKKNATLTDAVNIYRKHTNDFVFPGPSRTGETGGIRKKQKSLIFTDRYDEPTYLTFRIEFLFNDKNEIVEKGRENDAAMGILGYNRFNSLPHPLFNLPMGHTLEELMKTPYINNDYNPVGVGKLHSYYSTYNYLMNSLGDTVRASMLLNLMAGLEDIQKNYPYYYKSVSGLSNLMKVDTTKGKRIPDANNMITIECDEALDLRITQILTTYRKICWDDVYQRWILPDIMRFFRMRIIISEMRLFHTPKGGNSLTNTVMSQIPSSILNFTDTFSLINDAMNEVMPTIVIDCEQCEFDFKESMSHIDKLYSSKQSQPLSGPQLKIHIGNIKETHLYGLNRNMEDIIKNGETGRPYVKNSNIYSDNILYNDNPFKWTDTNGDVNSKEMDNEFIEYKLYTQTLSRYNNDLYNLEYYPFSGNKSQMLDLLKDSLSSLVFDNNDKDKINKTISLPLITTENISAATSSSISNFNMYSTFLTSAALFNSTLKGNIIPLLAALKDSVYKSTVVSESSATEGRDIAPLILENILINIASSTATKNTELRDGIIELITKSSSATDISNKIDRLFNETLEGLSNEAVEDKDKGYKESPLVQPEYKSTATEEMFNNPLNKENEGLSNEAVEDKDKGYKNPGMINKEYLSSATEGMIDNPLNKENEGLSNEAVEDKDKGYKESPLVQPEYKSSATEGTIINPINKENEGLSNEAVEDKDKGYKESPLVQPEYKSTATEETLKENTLTNNIVESRATEGKIDAEMEQPKYESIATDKKTIENPMPNGKEKSSATEKESIKGGTDESLSGTSNEAGKDYKKVNSKVLINNNNITISEATSIKTINAVKKNKNNKF